MLKSNSLTIKCVIKIALVHFLSEPSIPNFTHSNRYLNLPFQPLHTPTDIWTFHSNHYTRQQISEPSIPTITHANRYLNIPLQTLHTPTDIWPFHSNHYTLQQISETSIPIITHSNRYLNLPFQPLHAPTDIWTFHFNHYTLQQISEPSIPIITHSNRYLNLPFQPLHTPTDIWTFYSNHYTLQQISEPSIPTIRHSNRYLTYMQAVYRCTSFPHLTVLHCSLISTKLQQVNRFPQNDKLNENPIHFSCYMLIGRQQTCWRFKCFGTWHGASSCWHFYGPQCHQLQCQASLWTQKHYSLSQHQELHSNTTTKTQILSNTNVQTSNLLLLWS